MYQERWITSLLSGVFGLIVVTSTIKSLNYIFNLKMAGIPKQTLQPEARHPSNTIDDSYSQDFRSGASSLIGLGNFTKMPPEKHLTIHIFPRKLQFHGGENNNKRLDIVDPTNAMEI